MKYICYNSKVMIRSLTLSLILLLPFTVFGQKAAQDEAGFVYRKEAVGGLVLHTSGWGGHFRYGIQKSYLNKMSFGLDVVSMRHPKETKVYNGNFEDGKGYYFGKLHGVMVMRPSFGFRRIIFQKYREQGVEVGINWSIGPSIAFAKPVYLQILVPTPDPIDFRVVDERYDPAIHPQEMIYGRSPWSRGLGETKIFIGGFAKFGLHFEYSGEEDGIKALEVGAALDMYPQIIPQMANEDNHRYFLNFYVNILFGRKYF